MRRKMGIFLRTISLICFWILISLICGSVWLLLAPNHGRLAEVEGKLHRSPGQLLFGKVKVGLGKVWSSADTARAADASHSAADDTGSDDARLPVVGEGGAGAARRRRRPRGGGRRRHESRAPRHGQLKDLQCLFPVLGLKMKKA
jgi:hypothetical protein